MSKNVLNIVSTSYRATLEEQDDTVLWLVQTLRANGTQTDILLRGSCVYYAKDSDVKPKLKVADWEQTHPADITHTLKQINESGAKVFYIEEDVELLGLYKDELMNFIEPISENKLPALFENYNYVWQW